MGGGIGGNFGNTRGSMLDAVSSILTIASFIPGVDSFTNIVSIPVDLLRGDYISAGLDAVGVIPFIGEIADGAKTVDKVSDTVKLIDKITDASTNAKKTHKVVKSIISESPHKLVKTHKITMSRKEYANFLESVRKNGITEPIKYVEFKGTKYVVDGHHRLQAAKDLNIKSIPVEKVSLPYKGYKTIEDLLWQD